MCDVEIPEPLTVADLIEKLKELSPDAQVIVEGCDCYGPASGVYEEPGCAAFSKYVSITRDDRIPYARPPGAINGG